MANSLIIIFLWMFEEMTKEAGGWIAPVTALVAYMAAEASGDWNHSLKKFNSSFGSNFLSKAFPDFTNMYWWPILSMVPPQCRPG